MMISVLMFIYFILFNMSNMFLGQLFYVFMFFMIFNMFYLFGMEGMKGDLYGMLGLDYISFYLVMLLVWMCSSVLILFNKNLLNGLVIILFFSMCMLFVSLDMLYLFIFFEFSMLPMFLIILFFGGFKERYVACIYMMVYTMMSSLPMLITIIMLGNVLGGLNLDYNMFNYFYLDNFLVYLIILMFLVKVPMFIVHIWLPKAHVEAPVYGSMILASVMLKMGGYGIIRCLDFMIFDLVVNDFFFCLCLIGGVIVSYTCLYQVDLKVLVAYSSIVHMGLMLMGLFSETEVGYLGSIMMMLSHGICSSGMFYLVNEIYLISGSRLLFMNKGLMGVSPVLLWMWLLMLANNLGVPPCFGILGELMLMCSCLMYSFFVFIMFFFIIFFTSCFVINMYISMMEGEFSGYCLNIGLISYYGSIIHLFPLNFFIIFMIPMI